MGEHDSFEDRLRAIADQIGQSLRRMSEVDLEQVADGYGIDAERVRGYAEAFGQWLSDRVPSDESGFGQNPHGELDSTVSAGFDALLAQDPGPGQATNRPGPHPLDLPLDRQGLALSALDSGRWTARPGTDQLVDTGEGPLPSDAASVVSEL
ncbi:MAG TPA: hypothetical protein VGK33_19935, partial [Chloroflexota bacterium]